MRERCQWQALGAASWLVEDRALMVVTLCARVEPRKRDWHCASARLEEERCRPEHGAELSRITHYTCALHGVQFVRCWRRGAYDGACGSHVR